MKKLTKHQRSQWVQRFVCMLESEAESAKLIHSATKGKRGNEGPSKNQRDQWAQLLERCAASSDPEQAMVVDIVAHLIGKLAAKHRAGIALIDMVPTVEVKARSKNAKEAADARYTVTKTDVALAAEFDRRRAAEPTASDWKIWKGMAADYAGGERYWQRIRSHIARAANPTK